MIQVKEKDFIEIDYVGRIKETNQVFDLTNKELAIKENIFNEKFNYNPKVICLGENQILKGIDKFLVDKEVGKDYTLELKPEEAFGKKDPKMMQIIPIDVLRKQKINPFPGLQINASGLIGTIRSVSGGRVNIDFNHPLAGKNIIYEIRINKIIENNEDKVKSLVENMFGLNKAEYSLVLEQNQAKIAIKSKIPANAKEELKEKAKQLIPSLELVFN